MKISIYAGRCIRFLLVGQRNVTNRRFASFSFSKLLEPDFSANIRDQVDFLGGMLGDQ